MTTFATSALDSPGILQYVYDEATQTLRMSIATAATAVITSIPASITSALLFGQSSIRKGFVLYNNSTATAFVAFASTASTAAFTLKMAPNSIYEKDLTGYGGPVSCIWDAANGSMLVTEFA